MKYITSIIKLLSLALLLIVGYACTDNFDKINRKDYKGGETMRVKVRSV